MKKSKVMDIIGIKKYLGTSEVIDKKISFIINYLIS